MEYAPSHFPTHHVKYTPIAATAPIGFTSSIKSCGIRLGSMGNGVLHVRVPMNCSVMVSSSGPGGGRAHFDR